MEEIKDSYHTMDELYDHRNWLFLNFCKQSFGVSVGNTYISTKDSEGKEEEGWFIAQYHPNSQCNRYAAPISYHLPINMWSYFDFAHVVDKIDWDGHTSHDVLERLKLYVTSNPTIK